MARPRCFVCERFARFLLDRPGVDREHVCKPHGLQLAKGTDGDAILWEIFDEAWQGINWRQVETR